MPLIRLDTLIKNFVLGAEEHLRLRAIPLNKGSISERKERVTMS